MSAIKIQTASSVSDGQAHENPVKVLTAGRRIKRMIFVASLYFKMVGINNPTRDQLLMVNNTFNLAYGGNALLFPAAVSGMIWDKVPLADIFKRYTSGPESTQACVDELLALAPSWVKYDAGDLIKRDVQSVFERVRAG